MYYGLSSPVKELSTFLHATFITINYILFHLYINYIPNPRETVLVGQLILNSARHLMFAQFRVWHPDRDRFCTCILSRCHGLKRLLQKLSILKYVAFTMEECSSKNWPQQEVRGTEMHFLGWYCMGFVNHILFWTSNVVEWKSGKISSSIWIYAFIGN